MVEGRRTAAFLSNSVHVTGTIVDPQPHPLIRFSAADGAVFQFQQNGSVSRSLGAEVPVAYQTQDPAGMARTDRLAARRLHHAFNQVGRNFDSAFPPLRTSRPPPWPVWHSRSPSTRP